MARIAYATAKCVGLQLNIGVRGRVRAVCGTWYIRAAQLILTRVRARGIGVVDDSRMPTGQDYTDYWTVLQGWFL